VGMLLYLSGHTRPNITFAVNGNVPLDMFVSANAGYELKISDYMISSFMSIMNYITPYKSKLLLIKIF